MELVEPVVARLGVMLEFEFAGSYEVRNYGSETLEVPNAISVIGPQGWRRSRLIIRGHIESLVVMFQPCGFHALFGLPTAPLSNAGTEGHSLLGHPVSRLHEKLGNLRSFAERAQALDAYFLQHLQSTASSGPVYKALHVLIGGHASVSTVARQAGLQPRQLERKALVFAGISPKTLSRIGRFSRAMRLRSESTITWTEIAHAARYYDHMHMIRDFREFAGEAPVSALHEIAPEHLIHFALDRSPGIT